MQRLIVEISSSSWVELNSVSSWRGDVDREETPRLLPRTHSPSPYRKTVSGREA